MVNGSCFRFTYARALEMLVEKLDSEAVYYVYIVNNNNYTNS